MMGGQMPRDVANHQRADSCSIRSGERTRMNSRLGTSSVRGAIWPAALLAGIAWLAMALLVEYMHRLEQAYELEHKRAEITARASGRRARLESELNATLFVAHGMAGFVSAYDDLLEPERVRTALELIWLSGRHLKNVALAPDNVIRYIYPMAGNELAIGLDYADNPAQWPTVQRAIAERRTLVDGPLELVQGGRALLSRTPVFLHDGEYWGMLSLVIEIDSLFAVAGVGDPDAAARYAVRRLEEGPVESLSVIGPQSIFAEEPVLLEIEFPGSRWQLAAVPNDGWGNGLGLLNIFRTAGYAAAAVIALLLFVILRERIVARWMALHDPLTRLPNRRLLRRHVSLELQRAERRSKRLGVLYIDLNGFKSINDRHGHGKGDEVLAEVAGRIARALGPEAFLARIGGDEFVAVLDSDLDLRQRVDAMRSAVREPLPDIATELVLDVAVGVARYPDDGDELATLMHAADQRMYADKKPTS